MSFLLSQKGTARKPAFHGPQVRNLVLMLTDDGKKVKVCVQQALGQGVFQVRYPLMRLVEGGGSLCSK
mgnify:CR=1 FL=1